MKCACLIYHKNAEQIYPKRWIDECVRSISEQTYQDFEILELNYGAGNERYTDGHFFSIEMPSHIPAMNFLIDHAFQNGFDVVFNNNLDDVNHSTRFEKQLTKIKDGYQLVSSNFYYFGEVEKEMNMVSFGDIGANLRKNHNVVCHPSVAMHKSFWDADLHYYDLLGREDLNLWQRAYGKGKRFYIIDEYLLFYRRHENQTTQNYGINGAKEG